VTRIRQNTPLGNRKTGNLGVRASRAIIIPGGSGASLSTSRSVNVKRGHVMPKYPFPDQIKLFPKFSGPFDAHRLETESVDIYFASYPAGTLIEPHTHETDNFGVITQGELILMKDDTEQRFGVGDWYQIPANVSHAAKFEQDTAEIEFWFKKEAARRSM